MLKFCFETLIIVVILLLIIEWIKFFTTRTQPYILIDFDTLADATAIYNRSIIYSKDDLQKQADYLIVHMSEQVPVPHGLRKAIDYIHRGYRLVFMTSRHECLRIETAKFLNDWQLPGELYMNKGQTKFNFKHAVCCELRKRRVNIVGVIDKDVDGNIMELYRKFKMKVI